MRNVAKQKTLYVSDLDGTLLNSGCRVSDASASMLNRAIADGANFTIATARTPATVSTLLSGVAMRLPAVVMTGAALWDTHSGIYSDPRFIPAGTVSRIVDIYRRQQFPAFIYKLQDNLINIYHYGAMSPQEQKFIDERIDNPLKRFEMERCCPDGMPTEYDNVVLFYAMQPDTPSARVYGELKKLDVRALNYHDIYGDALAITEVFGPEVSKAAAVRRLADSIGAERIVAFGDNINDIPLLEVADVSVAVSNAVDAVKEKADIIIGDHDSDSVARFILEDSTKDDNTL